MCIACNTLSIFPAIRYTWYVRAGYDGSTYFMPIAELSGLFINVLLAAFSEEVSYFVMDERNNFQPAGITKFAINDLSYYDFLIYLY
jgi:hypothetical protein